jgi:hypothetical protein
MSCVNKIMEQVDDSRIKSSRWSATYPSLVIRRNIVFTNFSRDNRGASGGLLAIA